MFGKTKKSKDEIKKTASRLESEFVDSSKKAGNEYDLNIIYKSIKSNLEVLKDKFSDCPDIIMRKIHPEDEKEICIIFIEGQTNQDLIQRDIITPLMMYKGKDPELLEKEGKIPVSVTHPVYTLKEVIENVLNGNTVIIINGYTTAVSCDVRKFEKRAIEEPDVEKVIKGSHDGFVEPIRTNIMLLRRRIKSESLKIKMFKVGKKANNDVAIVYMENISNPEMVGRMEARIRNLDYDAFEGIGMVEQLITDRPYSPFPQFKSTERVDRAVAGLMEGRVLLLLDGTPVSSMAPVDFFQFFQAVDDYNSNWIFGSIIRLLRFSALFIAVFFPALYIAILTFHFEAIPLNLMVPLLESRSRVPFPPIVEALIMEITFELLREAGVRLPKGLGPTIGIVGGLVIGQTAIEAGIVSNIMVIIVAITAIATFVVPTYDIGLLLRFSRFGAMILASVFGVVGIVVFSAMLMAHVVNLESLGEPYFQPLTPYKKKDMKDTFIRLPLQFFHTRPEIALPRDIKRKGDENGKK